MNRRFGELFDGAKVVLRRLGQLLKFSRGGSWLLPARKSLIHRLAVFKNVQLCWKGLQFFALITISHAKLDFGERVEHIQLGERPGIDAVDLRRVIRHDGVEPAASPRPAGGRAK